MFFNLSSKGSAARLSLIIFILFVIISNTLVNENFHIVLSNIIDSNPNKRIYFPVYLILGLIGPIAIRIKSNNYIMKNRILDPYLILLTGQIITEALLVPFKGKGIGFLIGIIFSSFRIRQIILFKRFNSGLIVQKIFLVTMFVIWSYNIIHIILYRIIPLVYLFITNG